MSSSISLSFHNKSNDEENSQVIIFKRVANIAETKKITKVSSDKLIIYLPFIYSNKIEESLEDDKICFNELTIYSLLKGEKYKIATPQLDTEGVFPAEIRIIAVNCDEFRIEIITPEAKLVTTVSSLLLEVFNTDGVQIMKVVDSNYEL